VFGPFYFFKTIRQNISAACLTSLALVKRPNENRNVASAKSGLFIPSLVERPKALITGEPLTLWSYEQALPTEAITPARSSLSKINSEIMLGTETLMMFGK
jgi:hypothetical protein